MSGLRSSLRKLVRATGYDVHKLELGRDPLNDIRQMIAPSPAILDVGANTGQTIRNLLRSLTNPVIHSFEPNSVVFQQLSKSFAGETNLYLNNFALGNKPGQQTLLENSNSDMSSFLPLGPQGWGAVQDRKQVQVSTVDAYCRDQSISGIDLLKSDTQGFDLEVLKGAAHMLAGNRVHLIYVEIIFAKLYENFPRLDQIYGFIADHGFELVSFYDTHYLNGRAGWADALFVNPNFTAAEPLEKAGGRA